MGKDFGESAKVFAKNLALRTHRVITRRQTLLDAVRGIVEDAQKLRRSIVGHQGNRRDASHQVRRGRRYYNAGKYDAAEEAFRNAITLDKGYALAYTYLGHTLYRQGRIAEAVTYWERAIEAEPTSNAAGKARQKIQHVRKDRTKLTEWLDEYTSGKR